MASRSRGSTTVFAKLWTIAPARCSVWSTSCQNGTARSRDASGSPSAGHGSDSGSKHRCVAMKSRQNSTLWASDPIFIVGVCRKPHYAASMRGRLADAPTYPRLQAQRLSHRSTRMEHKQVIVLRKDLNMRKGKMIAQGAHA